jgi:antirestriction protein ArdC
MDGSILITTKRWEIKMATVHEIITQRFIDSMNKDGIPPWQKGFVGGTRPMNLESKKAYSGINIWLTLTSGRGTPYWLTWNQIQKRNGKIKTDEKSTPLVFSKQNFKEDSDGNQKKYWVTRYYKVWNLDQVDGIEYPKLSVRVHEPLKEAEAIVNGIIPRFIGPEIQYGDVFNPCYKILQDIIQMPNPEQFHKQERFYKTLFHELVHSTGHESRLARFTNKDNELILSDESYGFEELVAEIGASFLCNECGILPAIEDITQAYVKHWAQELHAHPKMIMQAASAAQKAFNLITGKNGGESIPEAD